MLWFALLLFLGYLTLQLYRRYRFRQLRRQVIRYKNQKYSDLPRREKRYLKNLVDQILDSGMTLDDDTNQVVDKVFKEATMAELYDSDEVVRLQEFQRPDQ